MWYIQNTSSLPVFPVNPKSPEIEGIPTIASLSALAHPASTSVSIITPPHVTTSVLKQAVELGVRNVWLQPGSESAEGVQFARDHGLNVIDGGACILVQGQAALQASKGAKM
ncbi:CoA-binding protein [Entophlyctis helioformis]|nr:CoA-binding protein [Entophlyctis helioformis]